jgi:hypothetical protein
MVSYIGVALGQWVIRVVARNTPPLEALMNGILHIWETTPLRRETWLTFPRTSRFVALRHGVAKNVVPTSTCLVHFWSRVEH